MVAKRKPPKKTEPDDIFISGEEGWEILEENAQRLLGMSAAEFIRRWDSVCVSSTASSRIRMRRLAGDGGFS